MTRANALVNNFTGGEVSPRIWNRPEVAKVKNGCQTIENGIVAVHGGIYKRSGTQYVINLPSTARHRFVRFQYSTEQSYMLIFGNQFIWFCKDKGIITHAAKNITGITQANPAVVTSTSHGFSNGDKVYVTGVSGMTDVNNRWFTVANVTANTFELSGVNSSAYAAYTSGGTAGEIVELATNYTTAQIQKLQCVTVRDVMYISHPNFPIQKLSRLSDTSWTLSEPSITTGPFRTINADDTLTLTPSSFSTSVTAYGTYTVGTTFTLTAASAYFDSGMVGGYFRLYEEGGGVGVPGAALGDSTKSLQNGDAYTYQGNVYGVSNLTGATTWEKFNRVPEHTSGAVKVIGSVAGGGTYFNSNFLHPGYCIVQITAFSSSTSVTARIVRYQMPQAIVAAGTTFWQEGAWSDYRGWPQSICLFEQRMFLAGTDYDPTVVWATRSGTFEDFEDGPEDDDAIVYRLPAGNGDSIRWLSGRRVLIAGTSAGEFALGASSQQEALSPSNVKATQQTDVGSADVLPVFVDQAVVYAEREGEPDNASLRIREFAYSFSEDRFNSVDLTVFSEHITGSGLTKLAFQRTPETLIWALRSDGQIACLTYQRPQEVVAWHRHVLGGSGLVKELEVTSGEESDELWCQVNRTIDSTSVAYVEVMSKRFRENVDAKEDAVLLDSCLIYSGSETSTLSGLWHLRGESVTMLINGKVATGTVGATGKITLPYAATKVIIGKPYTMTVTTQEIEAGAQAGTAQSRKKRISQTFMRMLRSLGGKVSGNTDQGGSLKPLLYRVASNPMDATPPLYSGYVEVDIDSGWDREQYVHFEHDDPLPCYLMGVVVEQSVTG